MENNNPDIDLTELKSFKFFDSYHTFFISYDSEGTPLLLLEKKGDRKFSHYHKTIDHTIINIFFSFCHNFLRNTHSLLTPLNFPYLTEGSKQELDISKLEKDPCEKFDFYENTTLSMA